jgi:hypothetical protein
MDGEYEERTESNEPRAQAEAEKQLVTETTPQEKE